ncbi:MAG: hypothetical protein ACXVFT_08260 [Solirubrobacteraceae bacterium]
MSIHPLNQRSAGDAARSMAAALALALALATPAVPAAAAVSRNTTAVAPGPPTWPVNPRPIARSSTAVNAPGSTVSAPSSGFDWGSAAVGAACAAGLLAIALGVARIHRRRLRRLRSAPTH